MGEKQLMILQRISEYRRNKWEDQLVPCVVGFWRYKEEVYIFVITAYESTNKFNPFNYYLLKSGLFLIIFSL